MPCFDASYYDYEDGDREDARREAAAARRRRNQTPEWYDADDTDDTDEDCGGGRGGCPGCDGCEKATQVYRIRRARKAYGGIQPGDLYLETGVRIFQTAGPVRQRRVMRTALSAAGAALAAAHLDAGGSRRIDLAFVVRMER
jgi:hypothetical protein